MADSPRVLALKHRVGFDEARASERSDEYVEFALVDFPVPEALEEWILDRYVGAPAEGEQALRIGLSSGEARITTTTAARG